MSVVLEFDLAGGPQANRALAGGVVGQEFVGGSEVAGLVFAVVVVPGEDDLVSEVQDLAPAAFEVFRSAGVRQAVGSHCFVDRHGGFPPFFVFSPWGTVYITLNGEYSKLYLRDFHTYNRQISAAVNCVLLFA